jgi:hypothetical protein
MSAMSPQSLQSNDCAMGKAMPHQPADHGKMPCCTSDCTVMGMAGLAQRDGVELVLVEPVRTPLFLASSKELDSLDWATVDPPPRLLS